METKDALAALAALAQDSRLAVFRTLIAAGPAGLTAGTLCERVGIAPSSLSFHMKELLHANMVLARPEKRFIYYSANFSTMNDLMSYLMENCCTHTSSSSCQNGADLNCTANCEPAHKPKQEK